MNESLELEDGSNIELSVIGDIITLDVDDSLDNQSSVNIKPSEAKDLADKLNDIADSMEE